MYKTCLISLIGLQWANKQIHHVVETNYYMWTNYAMWRIYY